MMIKDLSYAVLLVVVQLSGSLGGTFPMSDEEPSYTVIRTAEGYEIRSYPPAMWVCYDFIGSEFTKRHQANSFFAIFDYLSGKNSLGVNISMASPTTVRTVLSADSQNHHNLYQMCLYLPKLHQENPPEPKEDGVFIQHREVLTLAARQFDHFMMKEGEWEAQMELLRSALREANEPNMDFNDFYGAAFDPPFDRQGRPNEVWIIKKE